MRYAPNVQLVKEQNALFLKSRLVHDHNFRDLISTLEEKTNNKKLTKILGMIGNKKDSQNNEPIVYYDSNNDEKTPLLKDYMTDENQAAI